MSAQNTFEYQPDEPIKEDVKKTVEQEVIPPTKKEPVKDVDQTNEDAGTDLIALDQITPMKVFTAENGLDPVIEKIRKQVEAEILDPSTEKGRLRIGSLARKIGSAKQSLKKLGKGLTEEWRAQTKTVTSETSRMEKQLDALRDKIKKPLDEYNIREANRIQTHEDRLQAIINTGLFGENVEPTLEILKESSVNLK